MKDKILNRAREFYFNADFDTTLRGQESALAQDPASGFTYLHEMSNHFLFAASPSDSIILHQTLSEDFLQYLHRLGIGLPRLVLHPDYSPTSQFTPFGWNAHTAMLNQRYAVPTEHPALATVAFANSRVFSQAFEAKDSQAGSGESHPLPGPQGIFHALEPLEAHMEAHLEAHPHPLGYMVKGNHGNAGTANRRLGPRLSSEDRRAVGQLLAENGAVALEPWQPRTQDFSVLFQVLKDGTVGDFRGHQTILSRDGSFLGILCRPEGLPPEAWKKEMSLAAEKLAQALHAIGYFGPVSLDAYVFETQNGLRLRPCVDVNARLSMARPAHGLSHRLPGKFIAWQWFASRKKKIPASYPELESLLGSHAYRPGSGTGIFAASPLRVREGGASCRWKKANRVGFALSSDTEAGLDSLLHALHALIGKA